MAPARILMIDDDPADFARMSAAFVDQAELVLARHAGEALEQLGSSDRFDLILLDQQWTNAAIADELLCDVEGNLPSRRAIDRIQQGRAILRHLHQQQVHIPIVFCSRVDDPEQALSLCAEGAYDFLTKREVQDRPDSVLHLLDSTAADRAFVRRVLRRAGVRSGRPARGWLLSQRQHWGRQWPSLIRALASEAARQPGRVLSPGVLHGLHLEVLPRLLEEHREPIIPADLRSQLRRAGLNQEWRLLAFPETGIWLGTADADGRLLVIVEPAAVASDLSLPADWQQASAGWAAANPAMRAVSLREVSLGAGDPFWGGSRLLLAEVGPGEAWQLLEAPEAQRLAPWPLRAGRTTGAGSAFWDYLRRTSAALQRLPGFDRIGILAPLLGVALPGAEHPTGEMRFVPLPRRLLSGPAATAHLPLDRQLLALHAGTVRAGAVAEDRLVAELDQLPRIEVRRTGWLNAFEEETLGVVLDVLSGSRQDRAVFWAGCDFLHVRHRRAQRRDRLTVHAREYDLVILAPQGICVLECKASTLPADFEHGHTQMCEARELIWSTLRGQPRGGIFLEPVLSARLGALPASSSAVPDDVLDAVPPGLAAGLRGQGRDRALQGVREHYRPLAGIRTDPDRQLDLDDFLPENRNCLPAVIGFVVAPEARRITVGGRGLTQQAFVLGRTSTLPQMLRDWLGRRPVFSADVFEQVRQALLHMSEGAEAGGLPELEGFEAHTTRGLGIWRWHEGQAPWTEQAQVWLVRSLSEREAQLSVRQFHGRWLVTVLSNLSGDLRWLDARGLPATHPRHLRRLALVFAGRLLSPADLQRLPISDRLAGAEALVALGSDPAVSEVLGQAAGEPLSIAQELQQHASLRWGWLPGAPLARQRSPGDRWAGVRRIFAPLLGLLGEPGGEPVLLAAVRAVQVTEQRLTTPREAPRLLEQLRQALHAARDLA